MSGAALILSRNALQELVFGVNVPRDDVAVAESAGESLLFDVRQGLPRREPFS